MNIENLEAINTGTDAEVSLAVKYGYFPAGGSDMVYKTVNLRTWTADTDGFVDMVTEDGPHFAIDAIDASQEDDVYCEFILEFTMTNAKGDFTVADLVIADKDDEIVYSLANDPASPVSPISPGSRAANPASCGLRSSAAATPPSGLTPRVKTPTFPTTC